LEKQTNPPWKRYLLRLGSRQNKMQYDDYRRRFKVILIPHKEYIWNTSNLWAVIFHVLCTVHKVNNLYAWNEIHRFQNWLSDEAIRSVNLVLRLFIKLSQLCQW
jgi:hypothetical protein